MKSQRRTLSHERRVLAMALGSGLPAMIIAFALLWFSDYSAKVFWTLAALMVCCWLGCSFALQVRVM